jgi:mono/diheme cytochrome c family protein
MRINVLFGLTLAALLAGCVGDKDTVVETATVDATVTPDSFLTYPNTIASLGAGSYTLEVGPLSGGGAGSYRVVITLDDGSAVTRSGSWTAGNTATLPPIVLQRAGGITIHEETGTATRLVLRRNGQIVATGNDAIDLPVTQISSASYAAAYYEAVDPQDERDTVEKWKQRNGFYDNDPDNNITHVVFRDALDLGYGRDMYVLKNSRTGRMAFVVNNYIVTLQPGSNVNYGPLNVDAAISKDPRFLKGTNAIEFSPANEDSANSNGDMKITKFFTFDASGKRITSADLDGRGVKHMPGMCWACHGGQTLPLDENGKFQPIALRSAKYNILGVADFEYSLQNGWHRDQMEDKFRLINSYVKQSYKEMETRPIAGAAGQGKWSADYGLALVNGRYGSDFSTGTYRDGFVPDGWKNGPGQENAELLFKRVVGPHCTACHSLQGREAAEGGDLNPANAINFSSYTKFMHYRSRIADYVFRRGIMPLSLRNYENFWKDPEGAPSILAAALADPSLFDASGKVIQPGRPVARAGASRTLRSPAVLDGSASNFATSYYWSADSSLVVFSNRTSARPTISAPDGTYIITLKVSNALGSDSDSVAYTVSSGAADQTALTFADDIRPLLATQTCTSCHSSGPGGVPGIPVYWSDEIDDDGKGVTLYQRVMARVNLKEPENSRLLARPTSLTHGGGLLLNMANAQDAADYNTIVNWIREGAVCGTNPVGVDIGCPQ